MYKEYAASKGEVLSYQQNQLLDSFVNSKFNITAIKHGHCIGVSHVLSLICAYHIEQGENILILGNSYGTIVECFLKEVKHWIGRDKYNLIDKYVQYDLIQRQTDFSDIIPKIVIILESDNTSLDKLPYLETLIKKDVRVILPDNPISKDDSILKLYFNSRKNVNKITFSSLNHENVIAGRLGKNPPIHRSYINYAWVEDKIYRWCDEVKEPIDETTIKLNDSWYHPTTEFRNRILGEW